MTAIFAKSFSVLVLTGLVCNAAAGLACALAGSLALAAAAVLSALSHITGIQCLNVLHIHFLLSDVNMDQYYVYNTNAPVLLSRHHSSRQAIVLRSSECV